MYKGPMDKDNKWGRVVGGKWGQLYLHNNKKGNKKQNQKKKKHFSQNFLCDKHSKLPYYPFIL